MLAILRQPIPRGFHLAVIRRVSDFPTYISPEAMIAPVRDDDLDLSSYIEKLTPQELIDVSQKLAFMPITNYLPEPK